MDIGPLTAESHPKMDSGSRSLSAMPADHVCRDQRLDEDHPRHHRNYYLRKRLG
jgi:hypothetical protein